MAEERDVPMLEDLLGEIDATMARLDASPTPTDIEGVWSELKNTILPLMKDVVASTRLDLIEIQDIVDPIKLTTVEAEENEELLKAFAASRPGDTALQERINGMLAVLERGDDEEDGEGDDEAETN